MSENGEKTLTYTRLRLRPIGVEEAKRYVAKWHRHNPAPLMGLFAACVIDDDDQVQGVAIVTHPTSRMLMDGWTCEVSRVATTGTRNACTMLYGACLRAAKALGYRRVITYTLGDGRTNSVIGWIETYSVRPASSRRGSAG